MKRILLLLLVMYQTTMFSMAGRLDTTFGGSSLGYNINTPDSGVLTIFGGGFQTISTPNDYIVAGGLYTNGGTYDIGIVRYAADGTTDTSFGNSQPPPYEGYCLIAGADGDVISVINACTLQADGKILIGGNSDTPYVSLVRVLADGSGLDNTFGSGGVVHTIAPGTNGTISAIALDTDGNIYVGGYSVISGQNNGLLAKYNSSGVNQWISNIPLSTGYTSAQVNAIAIDSTNSYIYPIGQTSDGSQTVFQITKYNFSGTRQTPYGFLNGFINLGFFSPSNASATAGFVQADGKLMVAGSAINGSTSYLALARFTTTGQSDTTFNNNAGSFTTYFPTYDNANGTAVALESGSTNYIVPAAYLPGTIPAVGLVRYLQSNGNIDFTFGTEGKVTNNYSEGAGQTKVPTILFQTDGKMVTVGNASGGAVVARYIMTADIPTANAQSVTTSQNTPIDISLTGSDPESAYPLTFSVYLPPSQGSLSSITPLTDTSAKITYTPNGGSSGPDSFQFRVTNSGSVNSSPATVGITVSGGGGDTPTANSTTASTKKNTSIQMTLTGSDPEHHALTFGVFSQPSHGTLSTITPVSSSSAHVTYTPTPGYTGSDSFQFYATNGTAGSNLATASITVTGGNTDTPTADPETTSTTKNNKDTITLTASDPNGRALTFSIVSNPAHGTLSPIVPISSKKLTRAAKISSAQVTYTPDANYTGKDSFTFRVYNGIAYSETATVTVTVTSGKSKIGCKSEFISALSAAICKKYYS